MSSNSTPRSRARKARWIPPRTMPVTCGKRGRRTSANRQRWRSDQETTEETMRRVAWGAAFAALLGVVAFSSPSVAADPPQFQVDPFWPKPLPNNWLFGQIGGLAVDSNDHLWVLQRPRFLTEDERA